MKRFMYALFDVRLREYGPIWLDAHEGSMQRNLAHAMSSGNGEAMASKYPSDFELHHLGAFNSESGQIIPGTQPVVIARLDAILRAYAPDAVRDANQLELEVD